MVVSIKTMTVSLCLTVTLLSHICAAEKELPDGIEVTSGAMFRANPARNGVFQKTGISSEPSEKWKVTLPGPIKSSPVVHDQVLYIGAHDGFYALDAETGEKKWAYPVKGGVFSSACVVNDIVLFQAQSVLYAVDRESGKKKWTRSAKKPDENNFISPAVVYGHVFTSIGRDVVAVDLKKGKLIYRVEKLRPSYFASLAFSQNEYYVASETFWGYGYAVDYETGKHNWKTNGPFESGADTWFCTTPAVMEDGSVIYNNTRGVYKYHSDKGIRDNPFPRYRLWGKKLLKEKVEDNEYRIHNSPSAWKNTVYVGRYSGKFAALNGETGDVIWMNTYPKPIQSDSSISAKNGLIYFGCKDGLVRALHTKDGSEAWSFTADGEVFSSPWVDDGALYVASINGTVYALSE